jgi:predicted DNA-binding transcriptional regulator AlpA
MAIPYIRIDNSGDLDDPRLIVTDFAMNFTTPTTGTSDDRLIKWREVQNLVGDISYTTWWRAIRDGKAPRAVKVSSNNVAWWFSEISEYRMQLTRA